MIAALVIGLVAVGGFCLIRITMISIADDREVTRVFNRILAAQAKLRNR
jgi:hypothetical protein